MRRQIIAGVAVLALLAGACGGGDEKKDATPIAGNATPAATAANSGNPFGGVRPPGGGAAPGNVQFKGAKLSLKASGAESFDGGLNDESVCTTIPVQGGSGIVVAGKSGETGASINLLNPKNGAFPVAISSGAPGAGDTRVAAFTLSIKGKAYIAADGEVKLSNEGKKGTLNAQKFLFAGSGSQVDMKVELQWDCQ